MTVRSVLRLIPCWPWKSAGKENGGAEDRQLKANNPEFNKPHKFRSNFIQTYKYNILTFLPLNLFEQFQRAANLYFLFQIIIMAIPQLTALNPLSTAIPLLLVLLITAVKDAYDDIGRHQSDNRLNGQIARVVSPAGSVTETKWCDIQVGNVLKVSSNEPVAADILLLSTSEASGLCFIETAELDGETNLKVRAPLVDVCEALGSSLEAMSKFDGEIVCELPNNRLEKFQGNLMWRSEKFSLDNSNIVLRGCVLRNTAWVFGVVVYAGHDSKLMMNSGESVFKRTKLDKMTNKLVIGIAILLAIICLFCSIMSYVWEDKTGRPFQLYLEWASYYKNSPALIGLFHFPGFIMVLNTLIPISLYISVEVIRLGQSLLINWDLNLYHEETDTPAKARNTALSEELGQIQYIFSDKTGTLTQNVMTFKECSINGEMYGHVTEGDMTDGKLPSEDNLDYVDFSSNRYADPNFKFHDFKLKDLCDTGEKHVSEFFTLIALCHTVMVEDKQQDEVDNKRSSTGDSTMLDVPDRASRSSSSASLSGKLLYQAQSPDEGALVSAARNFGFIFKRRTPNSVVVETNKTEETYEILNILDFDNVRKRMSVIVRKDGKIKLFCKGADTIMFGLLSRNSGSLKNATQEHLDAFASNGLRTLCLASKELSEKEYADWDEKYTLASQAMEERDEKLFQVYEEIEKDLDLLGATAIEDKLQDGVPETIANLADANIKIWVLTGDKQETAVNIGYSCMLLTDDMNEIFTVDGDSKDAVREQIRACAAKVKEYTPVRNSALGHAPRVTFSDPSGSREKINVEEPKMETIYESEGGFALVVPGKSLAFALETDLELEFLELAKACKAVICCRVTPLQKALVVDLVKRNVKATTLAIGDGANDVSMIKAAHIGVGISGREGRQAVLSADFSFAQFRFLERLLLVHGRWSYWRMSKFLNYFFYKNFAFTLVQFWYNLFSGFSAQTLYDPWFISVYNVCFTSLPVLAMGILDQDVSEKNCLDYPKLYVPGQQNRLFNKYTFAGKLVHGLLTSCLMFFIPYGIYKDLTDSDGLGHSDLNFFAVAVGCILVIVVNLQMALDTAHWTWINHFFIWGSIVFYFLYTITLNSEFIHSIGPAQFNTVGAAYNVYGSGHLWATLFLTAVLCLCPVVGSRWVSQKAWPTLTELIRRGEWKQRKVKTTVLEMRYSQRNTRQRASWRRRSGYAFAQTPGIGSMIMSGKWIPKKLKLPNLTKSRSLDLLSKSREPTDGKSRSLDNRRTDESVTPATRKSTT